MKRILSVACGLALAVSASAIPFDNSAGGPAVATVPGDYATLTDAAAGYNAVVGGLNRPWTISITASTTETAATRFGNVLNAGASLTIKPAPAVTATITYTNLEVPPGTAVFGHLVFGVATDNVADGHFQSNDQITIDGSNQVAGTTRDLTIAMTGASAHNNLIRVAGNNDGVVIKNVNLDFRDTAGSYQAINFAMMEFGSVLFAPDNGVIENCFINVAQGTGVSGFGVATSSAQGAPANVLGQAIENLTIRDSVIQARQRGSFFQHLNSFTKENTTWTVGLASNPPTGGFTQQGWWLFTDNSSTSGVVTITNSSLIEGRHAGGTAAQGYTMVDMGLGSGRTYNLTNNIVFGNTFNSVTPVDLIQRGFLLTGGTATYNFEHNTVYMPQADGNNYSNTANNHCIRLGEYTTGQASIRNNMLINGGTGAGARVINSVATAGANLTIEGNLLFGASGTLAQIGATSYPTHGDLVTGGFNLPASGGQGTNPFAVSPPLSIASLRFASEPVTGLTTVASSNVLTDIDGDVRPATDAIPGADQPPYVEPSLGATGWSLYH